MAKQKKPYTEPVQRTDVETSDNFEGVSGDVIESIAEVNVKSDMLEEQGPTDIIPDTITDEQGDVLAEEPTVGVDDTSETSGSEDVAVAAVDEHPVVEEPSELNPTVDFGGVEQEGLVNEPVTEVVGDELQADEEPTEPSVVQTLDEVEVVGEYNVSTEGDNAPEEIKINPLAEVRVFLGEPVNFPVAMCEEILETKKVPARTRRGNWLVDTQREKNIDKWSLELMYDFIDGDIELSGPEADELAWNEIYRRYQLSPGTYREDAIALIMNNTPVTVTKSGLLIRDTVRESLGIEHWTYKDLRAALLGDIEHPFTDDQFMTRLREVSGVDERFDAETLINITMEKGYGTMTHNTLESRLEQYKKVRLGGTRQSAKVIGDNHAIILREIRRQLDQEYPLFAEGWKILLSFVKREMNTLFNDKVRYDSWKMVPLAANDLRALEDVLTLLVMSVEDDARKNGLEASTIRELTEHLTTEEGVQKLLVFYTR